MHHRVEKAGSILASAATRLNTEDSCMAAGLMAVTLADLVRIEGASGYQLQNFHRLKAGKFRVWKNAETGYRCLDLHCAGFDTRSSEHTAWGCPAV
jgi:hypothetical protein